MLVVPRVSERNASWPGVVTALRRTIPSTAVCRPWQAPSPAFRSSREASTASREAVPAETGSTSSRRSGNTGRRRLLPCPAGRTRSRRRRRRGSVGSGWRRSRARGTVWRRRPRCRRWARCLGRDYSTRWRSPAVDVRHRTAASRRARRLRVATQSSSGGGRLGTAAPASSRRRQLSH